MYIKPQNICFNISLGLILHIEGKNKFSGIPLPVETAVLNQILLQIAWL